MEIPILYSKDDLLACQLFVASRSEQVKRNRRKTIIILAGCAAVVAISGYLSDDSFMMYYALIALVAIITLYPLRQRVVYKKHYKKFVEERFKKLNDLNYSVTITPDVIYTKSKIGDLTIKTSQVEAITETGEYFFIKISSGDTLNFPKRYFNCQELSAQLAEIANRNHFSINQELNWKWK